MTSQPTCFICNEPFKGGDCCPAERFLSGVRDTVTVHPKCIDDHDRTMHREAWLNSPGLRKAAHAEGCFTFRDWYDGKTAA